MSSSLLSDAQWQPIYALLRTLPGLYVGNEPKVRAFFEAVLWVTRTGAQWRMVPATYGHWNSIYKRFARWCDSGVWARLLQQVAATPDLEWLVLDSTTIRAHPCAAGAQKKTVGKRRKRSGAVRVGLPPKFTP